MNKEIKKADNYFERVKGRANQTKYKYYFFDYLYFKGEAWAGKKDGCRASRCCFGIGCGWWFSPVTFSYATMSCSNGLLYILAISVQCF